MTDWKQEERRTNNRLHEDDIKLIVTGIAGSLSGHVCRFSTIKTKDMETVVEFVQGIISTTETTKKLVWKIIVSVTVVSLLGWLAVGFIYRIADAVKGYIK